MTDVMDKANTEKMSSNEAAAYWDARLRHTKEYKEFHAWRKNKSENNQSFARLQKALQQLEKAKGRPELQSLRLAALTQNSNITSNKGYWKVFSSIAAGVLILITSIFLFNTFYEEKQNTSTLVMEAPHYYSTTFGQHSTITLEDGSIATLNTDTRIKVNYSEKQREIQLLKGQAMFDVAKNPNRPFIVLAGKQSIKAIGTIFDVRLNLTDVQVTMIEGVVEVNQILNHSSKSAVENHHKLKTQRLVAGQQLITSVNKPLIVKETDVNKTVSWRDGRVIFENKSLIDAIQEMNRYSKIKIIAINPKELSKYHINGMFVTGNQLNFIEALEAYFPIKSRHKNSHLIEIKISHSN